MSLPRPRPQRRLTLEGLPLDPTTLFDIATTTTSTDAYDMGPARRVECQPPQCLSTPSLGNAFSKNSPADPCMVPSLSKARLASSLTVGPNDSSLIDDDDDDELMDYFGNSSDASVPLTSPAFTQSSSHWNLHEHNVPTLPSFYPLERSSVFVTQVPVSIMATEIVAVLKSRSISATYNSHNAKVDCVSKKNVEFRIRFYCRRGEDYNHGIIVEVQRRTGFDLSYAQDVYAILDAVEGKNVQ